MEELNYLEKELETTEEEIKYSSKGQIKVADTIYPGVRITIGNSTYL